MCKRCLITNAKRFLNIIFFGTCWLLLTVVSVRDRRMRTEKCVKLHCLHNTYMHTLTEVITCLSLVAPDNGALTFTPGADNSSIGLGSVAVYSCHRGYVLSGESRRECVSDSGGSWTGTTTLCQGIHFIHTLHVWKLTLLFLFHRAIYSCYNQSHSSCKLLNFVLI